METVAALPREEPPPIHLRGGGGADDAIDRFAAVAKSRYHATYLMTAPHPLCSALLCHFYVVTLQRAVVSLVGSTSSSSQSAPCVVGVLEYASLVHVLKQQLGLQRPEAQSHRQHRDDGTLWSMIADSHPDNPLSAHQRITLALRASRVDTIVIAASDVGDVYGRFQAAAAAGGSKILVDAGDVTRDVIPVLSVLGSQALLGLGRSPPHEFLFLQQCPYATAEAATFSSSCVTECQLWRGAPSPLITTCPRTYAMWFRAQLLRDAGGDALSSYYRRGSHLLPRDVLVSLKSDRAVEGISDRRAEALRAAQIEGILATTPTIDPLQDIFLDPKRFEQRNRSNSSASRAARLLPDLPDSSTTAEQPQQHVTSASSVGSTFGARMGDDDASLQTRHRHARRMEVVVQAWMALVVSSGGRWDSSVTWRKEWIRSSVDAVMLMVAQEKEMGAAGMQMGRSPRALLAAPPPHFLMDLCSALMFPPAAAGAEAYRGVRGATAVRHGDGVMVRDVVSRPATAVACFRFLVSLERLRRIRLTLAQKAVLTASAAARQDFFHSDIVRVMETWIKERTEKALGQVGHLVGARMAVEVEWKLEAHPKFGAAMRLAHFPSLDASWTVFPASSATASISSTAGVVLTPLPVMRYRNAWRRAVQIDPVLFRFKVLTVRLAAAVAKLSKRLVCSPGELSLVMGRETAIATVLRSLPLIPGDTVLVVEPPVDGSFSAICTLLQRRMGVHVVFMYEDPLAVDDDSVAASLDRTLADVKPILCLMSMVSRTARPLPTRTLVAQCSQRGVLSVVDGSEAVGNVASLSVSDIDCDVFIASLDGYGYCCPGVTAMVIKARLHKLLTTLTVSYFYRPRESSTAATAAAFSTAHEAGAADTEMDGGPHQHGGPDYGSIPPGAAMGDDDDEVVEEADSSMPPLKKAKKGKVKKKNRVGVVHGASPWGGGGQHDDAEHTNVDDTSDDDAAPISADPNAENGDVASGSLAADVRNELMRSSFPQRGSSYAAEWWYTGLSDVSSLLAVISALQFQKLICFSGKEYCSALAREAEGYLCTIWRVPPIVPPTFTRSHPHGIVCVQLPFSSGRGAPDAVHVQQLLADQCRIAVPVYSVEFLAEDALKTRERGYGPLISPSQCEAALIRRTSMMHRQAVAAAGSNPQHGSSAASTVTVLLVRLALCVFHDMMDVKRIAAAVIRIAVSEGWTTL